MSAVSELADWIAAIPLEDWPQQHKIDEQLRPAMVTDLAWHSFGQKAWPVVHELGYDETQVRQLMLSVVMPGHSIPPHCDQQPDHWLYRVHVPLLTNPQAVMVLDGEPLHLEAGRHYFINTRLEHSVANNGATPRIHFMFDVSGED